MIFRISLLKFSTRHSASFSLTDLSAFFSFLQAGASEGSDPREPAALGCGLVGVLWLWLLPGGGQGFSQQGRGHGSHGLELNTGMAWLGLGLAFGVVGVGRIFHDFSGS